MAICPVPESLGLVGGLLETVDCHIRVLVHDSYESLVGPNTWFAAAFTGLLTIYIALVGYQLLLGRGGLRVLDLPVAALKIGLIFAFVTSWAAYQRLVFDLLFDGSREIIQVMLTPITASSENFNGDLYVGLEDAYADLTTAAGVYGAQASPAANILQGGPMLGSGLLWLSAIGMLLSTVGFILAAKIVLGFLLAVGPIFIGLSLFDTTRGLFDGWLRTTIGFALAPIAANVFGAGMLMMLAPFLGTLTDNATRGEFDMGPIVTIGLIVCVFTIVMVMAARLGASITGGFTTQKNRDRAPRNEAPAPDLLGPRRMMERAEETAARAAMMDRAGTDYTATGESRRVSATAEAAGANPALVSERIGQSGRRPPMMRREEV